MAPPKGVDCPKGELPGEDSGELLDAGFTGCAPGAPIDPAGTAPGIPTALKVAAPL